MSKLSKVIKEQEKLYNALIDTFTDKKQFTLLTQLLCQNNGLSVLDVSNNTLLTGSTANANDAFLLYLAGLNCSFNNISVLDISANPFLVSLLCNDNFLTELITTSNIALTVLRCENNNINAASGTAFNVDTNINLVYFTCQGNSMTPTETDNILISIDANNVTSDPDLFQRILRIDNNRTSASDTAYNNLIADDWNISQI